MKEFCEVCEKEKELLELTTFGLDIKGSEILVCVDCLDEHKKEAA